MNMLGKLKQAGILKVVRPGSVPRAPSTWKLVQKGRKGNTNSKPNEKQNIRQKAKPNRHGLSGNHALGFGRAAEALFSCSSDHR
jgi:hypothetical protein